MTNPNPGDLKAYGSGSIIVTALLATEAEGLETEDGTRSYFILYYAISIGLVFSIVKIRVVHIYFIERSCSRLNLLYAPCNA